MFLGCTLENPSTKGKNAFDPATTPGCVNALHSNKDILLENLVKAAKEEDEKTQSKEKENSERENSQNSEIKEEQKEEKPIE